ncbi:MAG: hypothetical protein HQL82_10690 [Magnetococcales bacterium]|nr:hypothetical protein [Magnetococcales bacterium]
MNGSRRWSNLQLLGWLSFFGWIIWKEYDQYYLAELQADILLSGFLLLALVFVAGALAPAGCGCDHAAPPAGNGFLRAVETTGHFLPMILFLLVGATSLSLKDSGAGDGAIKVLMPDVTQDEQELPDLAAVPPGQYLGVTLIDLYSSNHYDADAPVELVGRLHHLTPEDGKRLATDAGGPAPRTLLYRFAMACCAADSAPLPLVLEGQGPDEAVAKSGIWVRIRGRTQVFREDPKLLALRVEHWQEVPEPARPFLNWLRTVD